MMRDISAGWSYGKDTEEEDDENEGGEDWEKNGRLKQHIYSYTDSLTSMIFFMYYIGMVFACVWNKRAY